MASITSSSSLLANFAKNCHFRWHRLTLLKLSLKAEVWIRALTIDIKPFNAPNIFLESFLSNAPRFNLSMCGWYLAHFSHLHECTNHIYGKWLTPFGPVIKRWGISFKFRLTYSRIIYEKTKGQIPQSPSLVKQNIQALKVAIASVNCRHNFRIFEGDFFSVQVRKNRYSVLYNKATNFERARESRFLNVGDST